MPNALSDSVLQQPLVDPQTGKPTRFFHQILRELDLRTRPSLNVQGQVLSTTKISGRTEVIGTTVANVDSSGIVTANGIDFTRSYTNKQLDNIPDGVNFARTLGTELNGGKVAQLNSAVSDTSGGAILSQSGTSATVNVTSFTFQYGRGQVNYNSGSVTAPSNTSIGYVFFDDPSYAGGAVTYQFTTNYSQCFGVQGRQIVGKITLSAGGGGSGGGGGGGNSNTCLSPNTLIRTPSGNQPIGELLVGDSVQTAEGPRRIAHKIARHYDGPIVSMIYESELITPGHLVLCDSFWCRADDVWKTMRPYCGQVCNLEIETNRDVERNYLLGNGWVVHNFRPVGC